VAGSAQVVGATEAAEVAVHVQAAAVDMAVAVADSALVAVDNAQAVATKLLGSVCRLV
jgi:hypothetical protein